MSNKAQRVGSRGPYQHEAKPSVITHTAYTVHAFCVLICKAQNCVACMTKVAVLYDSYSTARSTHAKYNKIM